MPKKKPKRHPWDKWFKRKRFKLIKGKHYDCMTHSMAQQVRNAAFQRNLSVSIPLTNLRQLEVTVLGPRKKKKTMVSLLKDKK